MRNERLSDAKTDSLSMAEPIMGSIDWIAVHTLKELIDSQDKFRRGVKDGQLVPLWVTETLPYFAYRFAYEQGMGRVGLVLDDELLEEIFIAEQRAFVARLN